MEIIDCHISIYYFVFSLFSFESTKPLNTNDKLNHVLTYLFLTIPVAIRKPKHQFLMYLFFILFGGIIEVIQPYFNRTRDLQDFIANILGISLGVLFIEILRKLSSNFINFSK